MLKVKYAFLLNGVAMTEGVEISIQELEWAAQNNYLSYIALENPTPEEIKAFSDAQGLTAKGIEITPETQKVLGDRKENEDENNIKKLENQMKTMQEELMKKDQQMNELIALLKGQQVQNSPETSESTGSEQQDIDNTNSTSGRGRKKKEV
jgi:hypothetical protein